MRKILKLRVILYFLVFFVLLIAIQMKKNSVIEERGQEVVSIPGEIQEHGWPVDVEKVSQDEIYNSLRVTVLKNGQNGDVYFYLSRDQKDLVKPGQMVVGLEDQKVIGRVASVSNAPLLTNGLYRGRINLKKTAQQSDQTIQSVDIVTNVLKNALSVPVEAVDHESGKNAESLVWLAENGKARAAPVKLGVLGHGRIEVLEGISEGARVIVNGHKALKSGAKLRVRECIDCETKSEAAL